MPPNRPQTGQVQDDESRSHGRALPSSSRSRIAKLRVYIDMRTHWSKTDPDEALIEASFRDPEAFGAFYLRHVIAVHRFFTARIPDWAVAADLTADVFTAAIAKRQQFDSRRGSAQTWLWQIARSKLADYLRHQEVVDKHSPAFDTAIDGAPDEYDLGGNETRALDALDALPDEQRVAVRRRVIDELSHAEIAERSGDSQATIRKRVSRGLQALRRALREPDQCTYSNAEASND